jgi:hypothetical protein
LPFNYKYDLIATNLVMPTKENTKI